MEFSAKIAVELEDAVALRAVSGFSAQPPHSRSIARGSGWSVDDVICTCGPHDRPFQEQHSQYSVALVLAGSFQYGEARRNYRDGQLMTPGSLLLGNPGSWFQCSHEHGQGDRCLSFHFTPDYFETITAGAGLSRAELKFRALRLPPVRELSALTARVGAAMAKSCGMQRDSGPGWSEIALEVAVAARQFANDGGARTITALSPSTIARISRTLRLVGEHYQLDWLLERLAEEAGLSSWHFLRAFELVTGVTPHQYIRRMRLRRAGAQLLADSSHVLDVAIDSGFGDLSNFNRAFKSEFGVTPRLFRRPSKAKPAAG